MVVSPYDVVLFAPFAGVRPHARLERRIANALVRSGGRVLLVTCSGLLESRCTVMESRGLEAGASAEERKAICAGCIKASAALHDEVPLLCDTIDIADVINPADRSLADEIFGRFLEDPSPSFKWSGVPFGAFWSYETVLKYKSDEFTPEFIEHLTETAKSGSIAFAAGRRLAQENTPTAVLVHSTEYGVNRSFLQAFENSRTLKFTFFNAGQFGQWERGFQILRVDGDGVAVRRPDLRELARESALVPKELGTMATWFDDRVGQRSALVYSSPRAAVTARDVRDRLRVGERRVVVVPSSSPDERHAGTLARLLPRGTPPYDPDEHFGFTRLLADTARANPDIAFVYRLHPRLAPNRRDPQRSPLLDSLISAAGGNDRPDNLILNTSEQGLSLYDVAMIADAGLNWSSTVGLELLALGVPVVGVSDAPVEVYPLDLSYTMAPGTVEAIALALRAAIDGGWSLEHMRGAARFIASTVGRTVIPVRLAEPGPPPTSHRLARALSRRLPAALRIRLSPVWQTLTAFAAPTGSLRQLASMDSESPIEVGNRGWMELIDDWLEWSRIPDSDAASEDQVLSDFAAHVVERLAPWDGSEGALRGLHEFVKATGAVPKTTTPR